MRRGRLVVIGVIAALSMPLLGVSAGAQEEPYYFRPNLTDMTCVDEDPGFNYFIGNLEYNFPAGATLTGTAIDNATDTEYISGDATSLLDAVAPGGGQGSVPFPAPIFDGVSAPPSGLPYSATLIFELSVEDVLVYRYTLDFSASDSDGCVIDDFEWSEEFLSEPAPPTPPTPAPFVPVEEPAAAPAAATPRFTG